MTEDNCVRNVRAIQSVLNRIIDTTGIYSQDIFLALDRIISAKAYGLEGDGYIEAMILLEKTAKNLEAFMDKLADQTGGFSSVLRKMITYIVFNKIDLDVINEKDKAESLGKMLALIKKEGVSVMSSKIPSVDFVEIKMEVARLIELQILLNKC